jgi:hypothetical protein
MILAAVDGTTCDLKPLGPAPPKAQLSQDFNLMYQPLSLSAGGFLVEQLRWFRVCEQTGGYGGRPGCRRGSWRFTSERIGRSEGILKVTENPELLVDGMQAQKRVLGLTPTRIVDEGRLDSIRGMFDEIHADHRRIPLRIKNTGTKNEELLYLMKEAQKDLRISVPLFGGQRIAGFDLLESDDVSYAAYVISQENEPGAMGHSLNVVRLDKWLVSLGDSADILQSPVARVEFQGPENTGLRFGTQARGLDGVLLLESAPTDSFFEFVWSRKRFSELLCDIYRNLPDGSKDASSTDVCSDTPK